jgi:hypothetical protein
MNLMTKTFWSSEVKARLYRLFASRIFPFEATWMLEGRQSTQTGHQTRRLVLRL